MKPGFNTVKKKMIKNTESLNSNLMYVFDRGIENVRFIICPLKKQTLSVSDKV
jgi:hypothetical protein